MLEIIFVLLLLVAYVLFVVDKAKFIIMHTRGEKRAYFQQYVLINNVGDELKDVIEFCKERYKSNDDIQRCTLFFYNSGNRKNARNGVAAYYKIQYNLDKSNGLSELGFWDNKNVIKV